eukprot:TRINITY_DN9573_c0_g1_i1.p2 TRINITY_DN9573_c0_g1~~TRINITY_DN9573_c0_g1_i1.p2  ORF type:complete len:176 (+),score=26.03 TRINITY_DN9573_c0_g1_i1:53-580(+)
MTNGYPGHGGGQYPPSAPPAGGYPPAGGGYPPAGGYPPPGGQDPYAAPAPGGYQQPGGYPPQQPMGGGYPQPATDPYGAPASGGYGQAPPGAYGQAHPPLQQYHVQGRTITGYIVSERTDQKGNRITEYCEVLPSGQTRRLTVKDGGRDDQGGMSNGQAAGLGALAACCCCCLLN